MVNWQWLCKIKFEWPCVLIEEYVLIWKSKISALFLNWNRKYQTSVNGYFGNTMSPLDTLLCLLRFYASLNALLLLLISWYCVSVLVGVSATVLRVAANVLGVRCLSSISLSYRGSPHHRSRFNRFFVVTLFLHNQCIYLFLFIFCVRYDSILMLCRVCCRCECVRYRWLGCVAWVRVDLRNQHRPQTFLYRNNKQCV